MKKYLLLKLLWRVLGRVPTPIGYLAARLIADVAFLVGRRRREVVVDNLRRVLDAEDERKLRPVARDVFRSLARNYFDLMRLPRVSPDEVEGHISIQGWSHFQDAVGDGRGVILATAHLGNFDVVAQLWAFRGYKVTVLVEPLLHIPRMRLMTHLRESHGLSFLPLGASTLKRVVRELRSGGVVIVACDRKVGGKGSRVNFLGEEASLPSGAVDLARMTGAAIIPAFSVRGDHGRFSLFLEPSFLLTGGKRDGQGEVEDMERLLCVVGGYVRRYPGQWVIMEPVWSRHQCNREVADARSGSAAAVAVSIPGHGRDL